MTHIVLLDTQMLIAVLDGDTNNSKHDEYQRIFRELLENPDVKVAITPLIRYEVVRKASSHQKSEVLNEILNGFHEFDIDNDIAKLAAHLYLQDVLNTPESKKDERNFDKRNFDSFHYATAIVREIEYKSEDTDKQKIDSIYKDYMSQI